MGVRKAFTEEEDDYIRENIGRLSLAQMAQALERGRSSIQSRIKVLGLGSARYDPPKAEGLPADPDCRVQKLYRLRDTMEADIFGGEVPMMQRSSYFHEYRALLAEISELEGRNDAERESEPKNTLGAALAGLAEQQRLLLERAAEP